MSFIETRVVPNGFKRFLNSEVRGQKHCYTPTHDLALVLSLASCTHGAIAEVGCNSGGSTSSLATHFPDRKIYAIDYSGSDQIMPQAQKTENIPADMIAVSAKHFPNVVIMDMDSRRLDYKSLDPVAFVFIDGDHSFDGVKADTELALNGVISGGIVSWHDVLPADIRIAEAKFGGRKVDLSWVGVRKYLMELAETMDVFHDPDTYVAWVVIP